MALSSSCACLQVPFAYCWSEALVPKPADWGPHIDVVGYCFLNEGSHMNYRPPHELKEFLAAGKPPVYIGFGSLIVDDAKKLTGIILEAAKETGQRVLLSRYGTNKQPLGLQCAKRTAAIAFLTFLVM
jgi:UDP:flavonoid glycosyltransferase YjiC (YdhE family)